jgi:hypothetical protein
MKRSRALVAVSIVAAASLSGCGLLGSTTDSTTDHDPAAAAAVPAATDQPTPAASVSGASASGGSASSGLGSVKDAGDLPDPCTLLSESQVVDLTGRSITQVDKDDAEPGATTRFCQWQQEGGQLAVFLSRTTADDFHTTIDGADPVDGVGEDAFQLAGHLYVLYGTVQIDVYSRGADDARNLDDSIEVAKRVIPKI